MADTKELQSKYERIASIAHADTRKECANHEASAICKTIEAKRRRVGTGGQTVSSRQMQLRAYNELKNNMVPFAIRYHDLVAQIDAQREIDEGNPTIDLLNGGIERASCGCQKCYGYKQEASYC